MRTSYSGNYTQDPPVWATVTFSRKSFCAVLKLQDTDIPNQER